MDFQLLRRSLNIDPSGNWASPEAIHALRRPDVQRIKRLSRHCFLKHNPFIRHIVRRTRDFLENEIDPHTNEPYLQRIEVRLFGESNPEAIGLPPFLRDAYNAAEEFCVILARRPGLNSGFMKTILLRRVGSTIEAGRLTAQQMLCTNAEGAEEAGGVKGGVVRKRTQVFFHSRALPKEKCDKGVLDANLGHNKLIFNLSESLGR